MIQDRVKVSPDNSLSVDGKNICEIDQAPQVFHEITSLNIQKNSLETLGEIRQFSKLRKLNVQDNSIANLNGLIQALQALPALEEIAIEGNPVMRNTFNCKSKILAALKGIQRFNSRKIGKDDQRNAILRVEKEKELWKTVKEEYVEMKAMKEVLGKLQIHRGISGIHPETTRSLPPIEILIENARHKIRSEFNPELYQVRKEKQLIERYIY